MAIYTFHISSPIARGGYFIINIRQRSVKPATEQALKVANLYIQDKLKHLNYPEDVKACYHVEPEDITCTYVNGVETFHKVKGEEIGHVDHRERQAEL